MSQQAGIWHYDRQPVSREQLAAFESQLTLQGPDGRGEYHEPGFSMLYRAFYITTEDALETQPLRTIHGDVLTWDGRLDNRDELLAALGRKAIDLPTDAELVAAALEAWGTKAFPHLIGDWALAWWNARERCLLLVRDYIGIRKLYYLNTTRSFYWSTDLAALVLYSGQRYTLCDGYFAGYFTNCPEPQLTPYSEIQVVPPGGYLEVTPGKFRVQRYWSFNRLPDIRYKTDAEYEEHFRQLFRQSVKRRMRTAYPILADLSGGLDSSSIVCMSYDILRAGEAHASINTLSYYRTDEAGTDERPYFTAIEEFIGKSGAHIEINYDGSKTLQPIPEPYFAPLPGYFDRLLDRERQLLVKTASQGNRLHFSGLGGDELLGGVQNPVPDLASLLWHLRLPTFCRQLATWAFQRKTTIWSLLGRSVVYLAPLCLQTRLDRVKTTQLATWLRPEFVKREHVARRHLRAVANTTDWLPGPPAPDSAYLALAASISGYLASFTYTEQSALPFYDRDLFQFLFAIPGEQLLRAHQRRSLMRRALREIVPDIVLSRKTKALGQRAPALLILDNATSLHRLLCGSGLDALYVDPARLEDDLAMLHGSNDARLVLLVRLLGACTLTHDLTKRQLNQETLSHTGDLGSLHTAEPVTPAKR